MIYLIALFFTCLVWITGADPPFYLFCGVAFVIGIVTQCVCYYGHVTDIECIKEKRKDIETYKKQANDLLAEVKMYLIDKFPEHELKIFDKITKNTADFLAIEYPEIKSDECFKKAVNNILDMKKKIYQCELNNNKLEKQLAVRKRTVKLSVIPILPKHKDMV
jgi:hypothetical protein